ncbi:hypothetical protein [Pseudonocardia sp. GCM10023141]|uniref:hypothetical protein n=1 Tax=Pseudonocardia sp. GCM10023141 TaxID=3252653 RepID=UPI00360B1C29
MSFLAQGCALDLGCHTGEAIGSAFEQIAVDVGRGAAELVVSWAAWWAETDSVNPTDNAVLAAQRATRPVIGVVLFGAILVQAIRLMLSRKGEPLVLVATGLIRFAAVSALGVTTLHIALQAGDALAADLLDGAVGNFAQLMQDLLANGEGDAVFLILLLSVLAAVLSLVQWVLMAMRQAGLLVLAAMLPLAASGSLTRSTRGWLDKLLAWLIAMVVYKPAAAFIYYIGFSYLSSPSAAQGGYVSTMLTGIMVLLLAVIAMPVLLKFFAWSGTQVGGGGGGGSGFLGAVGAVAMSRDNSRSAVDRAAAMEAHGPGSQATMGRVPMPTASMPAGAASTAGGAASAGAGSAGGAAAGASAAAPPVAAAVAAAAVGSAAVRSVGRGMTGNGGDTP